MDFNSNVYLVFGDEKYRIRQWENELLDFAFEGGDDMLNKSMFDNRSSKKISDVLDACDTLPFMSQYRVVAVRDSGLFVQGRKADSDAAAEYLKTIPETTILYFIEEKVDKRNALYKAVNKTGQCLEFTPLKDNELVSWVVEKSQKRLNKTNGEYLIKCVGGYMETLEGEINKLLAYVPENAPVTQAHINEVCTLVPEVKIFEMVAAIGEKNTEKALDIYNNLLESKESPFGILKMIARQFKLILECKFLSKKGLNNNDIAAQVGIRSFIVRDCLSQAKNFSNKTLLAAIKDCFDCDLNIKSGKISDKLGVELIIVRYS